MITGACVIHLLSCHGKTVGQSCIGDGDVKVKHTTAIGAKEVTVQVGTSIEASLLLLNGDGFNDTGGGEEFHCVIDGGSRQRWHSFGER